MNPFGYLVFGGLVGYAGFREARTFQGKHGRSPWGWDPVVWGTVVFLSGLIIGAILLCIARRTTKPAFAPAAEAWPSGAAQRAPVPWTVAASNEAGVAWSAPPPAAGLTILPR